MTTFYKKLLTAALIIPGLIISMAPTGSAQCTYVSPTVAINSSSTDINGNCVLNVDLSYIQVVNGGNKYNFVHIWVASDYPHFDYSSAPVTSENTASGPNVVLDDAIATFVIEKSTGNNPTFTLLDTYSPDVSLTNTTQPGVGQLKGPADVANFYVITLPNDTFEYHLEGVEFVVPGGCDQQLLFQGDAWSSQANSADPTIHCSMLGFIALSNNSAWSASRTCSPLNIDNKYNFNANIAALESNYALTFDYKVYQDVNANLTLDTGTDLLLDTYIDIRVDSNTNFVYEQGELSYSPSANLPEKQYPLIFVIDSVSTTNFDGLGDSVNTIYNGTFIIIDSFCIIPLDVNFYDQKAVRHDDRVLVNWTASSTADVQKFVVQRRYDNTDWMDVSGQNINWKSEAWIENYQVSDPNNHTSYSYYRIKAISANGEVEYSREMKVNGLGNIQNDLTIFPNPAQNGTIQYSLYANQAATVRLFSMTGQLIAEQHISDAQVHEFKNIPTGFYLLELTVGDKTNVARQKVFVQ